MPKINGNVMAQVITLQEGKKVSVDVAQVHEVIRLVRRFLSKQEDAAILQWVRGATRSKKA